MRPKAHVARSLGVRRGLDEAEAAVYPSLSPSFFRTLVDMKVMPRPRIVGQRRIWDVDELGLAFKALPREGGDDESVFESEENSWAGFK